MIVKTLVLGQLQANGYLLGCAETHEAVMIDPGGNGELVSAALEEAGLALTLVLNTHAHFDHIGANKYLADRYHVPILIHELELPLLRAKGGACFFGMDIPQSPDPGGFLRDGDVIRFGKHELTVLHTPGHSAGHVCFYAQSENLLFSGDLLFAGSVGRADLHDGDMAALEASIRNKIYALPDNTDVFPGHGPKTTVIREKLSNPFVRG